jgi:phosphoribosylamine-glycine ligase
VVAKGSGAVPAKNREAGSGMAPKTVSKAVTKTVQKTVLKKDGSAGGKAVAVAALQADRSPPALPIPIASFTF